MRLSALVASGVALVAAVNLILALHHGSAIATALHHGASPPDLSPLEGPKVQVVAAIPGGGVTRGDAAASLVAGGALRGRPRDKAALTPHGGDGAAIEAPAAIAFPAAIAPAAPPGASQVEGGAPGDKRETDMDDITDPMVSATHDNDLNFIPFSLSICLPSWEPPVHCTPSGTTRGRRAAA